jgi:hypothetical protein
MLRRVLILASLGEVVFGLLLLAAPPLIVRLLVAKEISGSVVTAARVGAVFLVALGIGCWPRDTSRRPFYLMLGYSALAACALVVVGLRGSAGVLLWPAAVVHFAIALLLWTNRSREGIV